MKEYSRFNEVRQIFVSLLLGGMLFCSCATDCMDDVLHSNTSVDKVDEKRAITEGISSIFQRKSSYSAKRVEKLCGK
mgnify:CR=1 FL=1